jgi:hypothetical protein
MELKTVAVVLDTVRLPGTLAAHLMLSTPTASAIARKDPAAQKQWKVVDWNELGSGQTAPYRMASGRRESWLRIGPGGMDAGGVPALNGQPVEQTGIRIKISSSN